MTKQREAPVPPSPPSLTPEREVVYGCAASGDPEGPPGTVRRGVADHGAERRRAQARASRLISLPGAQTLRAGTHITALVNSPLSRHHSGAASTWKDGGKCQRQQQKSKQKPPDPSSQWGAPPVKTESWSWRLSLGASTCLLGSGWKPRLPCVFPWRAESRRCFIWKEGL